jgi:predicted phosphodiesterase
LDEQAFVERCKDLLTTLPPIKSRYTPPEGRRDDTYKPQEMALIFSDCQIGEKTDMDETGLGVYNMDVFQRELTYLGSKVIKITDMHRKSIRLDNLNIFMLGDMVEGEQIFKGQGSRLEDNVMKQFFTGLDSISGFLRDLAPEFRQINCYCIPGNHGRVNAPDESKFYVNWDFMLYRFLEEKLKDVKNLKFDIPTRWWNVVDIQGWKFFITHGNDIQRFMGMPWYGMERYDHRMTKVLKAKDIEYDYLLMGHHHTPFQWDASWGERIGNGTFSRCNYFAAKKLQSTTRPSQMLFGVHPQHGISFRYLIRLDNV